VTLGGRPPHAVTLPARWPKFVGQLLKAVGVAPIAREPAADFSDRICVVASQGPGGAVHRADKLYSREDATLVASELNREWPSVKYWAAPATADEIKAHAAQAARLIRSIAGERS
jgi:hypothetical protein